MAKSLANNYRPEQRVERDELRSAAYLALVQAARTFDPARKVNFATYARHRIRGALRDYLRFWLSESWRGEGSARLVCRGYGDSVELQGRVIGVEAEKPVGAEIETLEAVESWLRRLPRLHALACRLIYMSGKSQEEVGRLLGYNRSQVFRMHNEALSWLLKEYDADRARVDGARPERSN
jgi:RNA polymerase sigma factor (sigma-70 family)